MEIRYVITHNGVYKCEFENLSDFDAFDWERFTMDFAKLSSYTETINWLAKTSEEFIIDGKEYEKRGKGWEDDAYFHTAQGNVWRKMATWMSENRWCYGRFYENAERNFRIYPMYGNELQGLEEMTWIYINSHTSEIPDEWEKEGYVDPFNSDFYPKPVEE